MTTTLFNGDCLDVMPTLAENSVDTIITDPPYGLEFMGKDWDHGIPGVRFWVEALRVAKPGAMMLAFGGTRTHHRLMCAIEDAGWEIRDVLMYVYGSGFPKSHSISKAIDKAAGVEREVVGEKHGAYLLKSNAFADRAINGHNPHVPITAPATPEAQLWDGWGTALKPAYEPIVVAMKPRDGTFANNALTWGVAGLNIDGGRVGTEERPHIERRNDKSLDGDVYGSGINGSRSQGTFSKGRWPANFIHDGSDEVVRLFPVTKSGARNGCRSTNNGGIGTFHEQARDTGKHFDSDSGSAARFFYTAKASRRERNAGLEGMEERMVGMSNGAQIHGEGYDKGQDIGLNRVIAKKNFHPTVKPLALMRYLCKLTRTPTGGTVLDPFMGSGSTGCAAVLEGRDFIGIELDAEYVEIARRRIAHWEAEARDDMPLFTLDNTG